MSVADGDDAAIEARMELTQLSAGAVLTADQAAAIQSLFDDLSEEMERGADAYAQGERKGREEAGGTSLADVLDRLDLKSGQLAAQKGLTRFYEALSRRPERPARRFGIRPIFAWYDLWIGAFWDAGKRRLYLFPVPCLGIVVQFAVKPEAADG